MVVLAPPAFKTLCLLGTANQKTGSLNRGPRDLHIGFRPKGHTKGAK